METVLHQPVTAKPSAEPGRRTMRLAIIVLLLSQFLPFYKTDASMESRYTGRGHGSYEEGYADRGYEKYVKSGSTKIGFECHPYAIFIIPLLMAAFFTRLYFRPGWNKWLYWTAAILAIGCTELPVPLNYSGGVVGAVALALMGYSIYQRRSEKLKT